MIQDGRSAMFDVLLVRDDGEVPGGPRIDLFGKRRQKDMVSDLNQMELPTKPV